jgi:signal transduction histidine kinase
MRHQWVGPSVPYRGEQTLSRSPNSARQFLGEQGTADVHHSREFKNLLECRPRHLAAGLHQAGCNMLQRNAVFSRLDKLHRQFTVTRTTNWPELVSGGMFQLSDPLRFVQGYARFLDAGRFGPVTEEQRSAFHQIQQAALRLAEIANALEGLASLEGAGQQIDKERISLGKLLSEVAGLPWLQLVPPVYIRTAAECDTVTGVFSLLRHALAGLVRSVFYDQLNGERPLSIWVVDPVGESERWIVLAATDQIQEAVQTSRESLSRFDERPVRGTMDLFFAGGVVRAHGGQLLALPTGVCGAVVALPRPTGE